jgi:anti-sigma factor RsiW
MDSTTIRQFVDGELPAEQAAAFERAMESDGDLRARVMFERSLRDAVLRSMSSGVAAGAPESLVTRVAAAMAVERESLSEACAIDQPPVAAPEVEPAGAAGNFGSTSAFTRLFRGPARANALAVAASLFIVIGAVVVGMFGDDLGIGLSSNRPRTPQTPDMQAITESAEQAIAEHDQCGSDDVMRSRIKYLDAASIHAALDRRLGVPVPIFDLHEADLVLVGGGECAIQPQGDQAVHLTYAHPGGTGGRLSIFMQPDAGRHGDLVPFHIYHPADLGKSQFRARPASLWTDGEVVFIVVACRADDHDRAMNAIAAQYERSGR